MIFEIRDKISFQPEWNDNKKSEKPVEVLIQDPSGASLNKSAFYVREDDEESYLVFDFCSFCVGVENLQIKNEKGEVVDATPELIVKTPGLSGLYTEIKQKYQEEFGMNKKK